MRLRRTSLTVAAAVTVPMVLLTMGGNFAWAQGGGVVGKVAAKGTVTCTSFTGTVKFSPPLVPGTATSFTEKETAAKSTLGSCISSPSGGPTSAKSVKEKPTTFASNACSNLVTTSHEGASFTISWPGIAPTKVTFSGAKQTADGYSLSAGTVTGSYATTSATANIIIAPASLTGIAACVGGHGGDISSISISGGSMTL